VIRPLTIQPDSTGSFMERPTFGSRPLKADYRGGRWFESSAAHHEFAAAQYPNIRVPDESSCPR
jgi:hypothetical protein